MTKRDKIIQLESRTCKDDVQNIGLNTDFDLQPR